VPVYGDAANLLLSSVGATGTGIVADRKRVKQGALPKGTAVTNAIRNVGVDIASFIPVAGDSAN
jgi:hypothetical protein